MKRLQPANPDIVWVNDQLECLLMAYRELEGFTVGVVFDDFPFPSSSEAVAFLSNRELDATIYEVDNTPVIFTYVNADDAHLVEQANQVAYTLKWRM